MTKKIIITLLSLFTLALGISACYQTSTSSKVIQETTHTKKHTTIKKGKGSSYKQVSSYKKVSYVVFGKSYNVLNSSKNYHEVGVASWYGYPFHHRYTASGERYNMYQMTAAHKTLPLATYVKVTNLKNNRQIIVKINDRGPFVGDRIIDLSYAAAKKLGMVGKGIQKVSVTALPSSTYSSRTT